MLRDLWFRVRALVRPVRAESDLADELQFHLDSARARLRGTGLDPRDARRRAAVAFGGVTTAAEGCRDARGLRALTYIGQDLRDAIRALCATPLVTAVALVSLTLGIGANTALFSIVDSLLLRPLPVAEPERLVHLEGGSWTNPIWEEIRARQDDLFDGAFAWARDAFDVSQGGQRQLLDGAYVSGRVFQVLGVRPALGRLLTDADDTRGGGPDGAVAVISHRLWRQQYAGAADVIGRQLMLERVPFTIVGVMPRGFFGPEVGRTCDVMIPLGTEPLIRGAETFLDNRSVWWLEIMGRLRPGQTAEGALLSLRAAQPAIREATMPPRYQADAREQYLSQALTLSPAAAGTSQLRGTYEQPLLLVSAVVAMVLIIACANIANLFLARALARRRELGLRMALGASRWRVARPVLLESALIAGTGAALGLLFARWSSVLLVDQLSTWRGTVFLDLSLNWRVLAFTAGTSMLMALLVGLAPALDAARIQPNESLKDGGRGASGDRHQRLRHGLVVVQVALSVTLVVVAGLFLRTFSSLASVSLGFSPDRLLVADVNLLPSNVSPDKREVLAERLRQAAARVPGVTHAAASFITPLTGAGWNTGVGDQSLPREHRMSWVNAVSPDWFATYGTTLLAGRDFTIDDRDGAPAVAIVNEAFARHFFPDGPALGRTIESKTPSSVKHYEVIGIVENAVYRSLREGAVRTMYLPLAQEGANSGVGITVASDAPTALVQRGVSDALRAVDPAISFTFRTFDELAGAALARERLVALLSGFFGGLALLLAGLGLYGVTSYSVSRRRVEIGVRMALGARPRGIAALVVGRLAVMLSFGVALGTTAAVWAAKYTESLLFQLEPRDPLTLAVAILTLLLVGGLAAWLPARRAARVDPAVVLRE